MNATAITKLIIGFVLGLTWLGLIFAKAYDAQLDTAEIIAAIKLAFTGLGVYHMMDDPQPSTPPAPPAAPTFITKD